MCVGVAKDYNGDAWIWQLPTAIGGIGQTTVFFRETVKYVIVRTRQCY